MTCYEDQSSELTHLVLHEQTARIRSLAVGLLADSALVCETLVRWLHNVANDCELTWFTTAQNLAARIAGGTRFDLVVIGDFLNATAGENLIAAARIIGGAGGGCPVIVVSAAADIRLQRELLGCGVRGHISTRMPTSAAAEAVHSVLSGGTYAQVNESGYAHRAGGPAVEALGAGRLSGVAPEALVRQKLSPREFQVLSLLELGYSNRRISAELGISENTVMVHLRHLMRKLGATNRTQAVFKANCLVAAPGAHPDL